MVAPPKHGQIRSSWCKATSILASWNHGMMWVGKDLKAHLLPREGSTDHVAPSVVQPNLPSTHRSVPPGSEGRASSWNASSSHSLWRGQGLRRHPLAAVPIGKLWPPPPHRSHLSCLLDAPDAAGSGPREAIPTSAVGPTPTLQLFQVGRRAGGTSFPRNLSWPSTNQLHPLLPSLRIAPSGATSTRSAAAGGKTTGIPSAPR